MPPKKISWGDVPHNEFIKRKDETNGKCIECTFAVSASESELRTVSQIERNIVLPINTTKRLMRSKLLGDTGKCTHFLYLKFIIQIFM